MRALLIMLFALYTIPAEAQSLDNSALGFLVKADADMAGLQAPMQQVPDAVVLAFKLAGSNATPVITSAAEFYDWRSSSSLHLKGLAIDVRGRDQSIAMLKQICQELRRLLGPDYDVVLEDFGEFGSRTHVHIEHQPKGG